MHPEHVVDGFLEERQGAGAIPRSAGVAVAIVKDRDVVFTGGWGLRDREQGLPVTAETLFEIASLTKAFTATSLAIADENGRFNLEEPINSRRELLPLSDPDVSRSVSLLDLLSHRSGLPAFDLLWYFGGVEGRGARSMLADLPLIPGGFRRSFTYSNLAYGAIGAMFEDLVGTRWSQYVSEQILAPLRMSATTVRPPEGAADVAHPYSGLNRMRRADVSAVEAAGAIHSTANDLGRWLSFQLGGSARHRLPEALALRMHSPHIGAENVNPLIVRGWEWATERLSYGLGWFMGSAAGRQIVFHTGFIDGFSAGIALVPESSLGFVVLTNLNLSDVPGLLVQRLLETHADAARSAKVRDPARFSGEYENPLFGRVTVEPRGGQSLVCFNGHWWPLMWKGDDSAEVALTAFGLELTLPARFEVADDGIARLVLPLSLDPRMSAQIFTRTRTASGSRGR